MQPDLVDYIDAQKARDRAIAKHSKRQAGRQFLSKARAIAQLICREKGSCTVNDIRERVGNPPEEYSAPHPIQMETAHYVSPSRS